MKQTIARRWTTWFVAVVCTNVAQLAHGATPSLPEGFPADDVVSLGNNAYTSPTFGDFSLDPNNDHRVIHSVIGPFIWSQTQSNIITLNSEWWGPLYVTAPGKESSLGHKFPYVRSENTGADYYVVVGGNTATPFYNHALGEDGQPIGWQNAIGIPLSDYFSHYKAAEAMVARMQQEYHDIRVYRDELATAPVTPGLRNIENIRQQAINDLKTTDITYRKFLFHFQRTTRAWVFVQREGGTHQQIVEAQSWVTRAAAIHDIIYADFMGAQNTVNNEIETIYLQRAQERQAMLQGSSSNVSTPTTGNGTYITTPVTLGDAINWSQIDVIGAASGKGIENFSLTATLKSVDPHRGSYYGPPSWYLDLNITGSETWTSYLPFGTGNPITGNIWIFVPQGNGRYWGAVFEGYGNMYTIHPAGNLNYDHTNVLEGTALAAPWQPESGVKYGWMVSTNIIWPGRNGNMRSNILLQAWP